MNNIFKSINNVMSDLGAIGKDRKNTHQNYAFRGIEDMYNAIHPIVVKHGIFVATNVIDRVSEVHAKSDKLSFRVMLTVNHKFYAEDGSFVEVITAGEGIDTSDKATSKALSMAMKYAFIQTFSIPTEDMADGERDSPSVDVTNPKVSQAPIKQVKTVTIAQSGTLTAFSQNNISLATPNSNGALAISPKPAAVKTSESLGDPQFTGDLGFGPVEEYVVPFGKKYKGKKLKDMTREEIAGFSAFLQNSAAEQGKEMNAQAKEYVSEADAYLKKLNSKPLS